VEPFLSSISLVGPAISALATLYFWLVRARGERPKLKCELSDRELFLGAGTAEQRQIGLKLGFVVANYCTLPNAVLVVKM
jgi:hypothetical protein